MRQLSRRYLFAMTGVLLVGYTLGALKLNSDNLWLDELYSLSNMGVFERPYGPSDVVDSLTEHSQNHVPFYFLLGAQWARLVGWSQLPMRYLSLLFGVLLVAWMYRFAADVLSRRTAVLAALLLTTSGFVLLYFHEIRMYTLLLLLTVVHAWLYWRLSMHDAASWRLWLAFVVSASALLYTHVFSVFFLVGLGLQHLIFAPRIMQWRRISLAWIASALTFLPYLPHFLRGALTERTIASLQETALGAPAITGHLAHIVVNGVELLWLPILVLAVLVCWKRRDPNIIRLVVIWIGIVLSLVLFNEVFRLIDKLRFRFFLASMPFFVILCAHWLLASGRWKVVTVPFLLVWIAGGLHIYGLGDSWAYSGRNTLFADIPPLYKYADALQNNSRELDKVVGFSRSKFVDWPLRHGKSIADYYFGAILRLDHAFVIEQDSEVASALKVDDLIDDHPYLLLAYEPNDRHVVNEVAAAIEAEYKACDVLVDHDGLNLRRYVYGSLTCDREYQPIHYENGIKIVDKFGDYDSDRGSVRIVTGWEVVDKTQLDQYNVSIQLHTAKGNSVAQAGDRHLHDNILTWYGAEMSTAALPPGDYRVVVILYDHRTNAKVGGVDLTTGETGFMLPILNFSVQQSSA